METKNAIDVRDLKISYRVLKSFSIKRSLLKLKKSEVEVFEAIKGISFSVPEGEIMGIVGKNGSGKSTMLRAIAGIFPRIPERLTCMDIRSLCCPSVWASRRL